MKKKQVSEEKLNNENVKKKRHIFRKILLGLLAVIVFLIIIFFINKLITKINDDKISKAINNIKKEEISYVFVEINPFIVLTMKDNIITNVACINEDCISIYNDINVKDKTIGETIDYLYKLSKDKGFDTSNGVKIKSTTKIEIADTDYIKVELITEATKDKLLSEVKNNESIKDINNDDYYTNLWEKLKKDKDYDKLYNCKMNNDELECFFIMNAITPPKLDLSLEILGDLTEWHLKTEKISSVLNKFDIKNKIIGFIGLNVYINNIEFEYTPQLEISNGNTGALLNLEMILFKMDKYSNYEYINIKDINLLKPSTSLSKMSKYSMGGQEMWEEMEALKREMYSCNESETLDQCEKRYYEENKMSSE